MKAEVVSEVAEWLAEEEAKLVDPEQVCKFGEDPASGWWPDFDEMDEWLLKVIDFDPVLSEANGLLFPVVDLLSYGNGTPKEDSVVYKVRNRYTSCYGHLYRKLHDGYELLQPTTIIALNKPEHPYTGWATDGFGIDGCGDVFETDASRAKGAILLHTLVAFIPGLELTRAWSKMFDAERNRRKQGHQLYGGCKGKPYLWVDSKNGKVVCGAKSQFNNELINIEPVNHVVDHTYGNTATLQPGFRATLQLRTMYRDVNDSNIHPDHAIGDFLQYGNFTGFQPTETFLDWDDFIKAGWVHMMNQALAIQPADGFKFDKPDYWCLALS